MLRKLHLHNKPIIALLITLFSICSVMTSPSANAASIYDNTLVLTSDLKYNDTNEGVVSISETWPTRMLAACGSTIYNDFLQSTDGGAWAVSQDSTSDDYGITVEWSKPDNTIPHASFYSYGTDKWLGIDPGYYGKVRFYFNSTTDVDTCDYSSTATYHATNFAGVLTQESWTASHLGLFMSTYTVDYPSGYSGNFAPTPDDDIDGDSLNKEDEIAQGTSDFAKDTDGDGLDDYVESQWNPNRTATFCGSECAYPNPIKRDVYVEADWMNDGTTSYKPNSTQIELVADAFDDKDINLHIDTGQYGGGNELPTYIDALKFEPTVSETDFFNLKNGDDTYSANFANERQGIWHYMITGDKLYDGGSNTTSGVSYAGDDDAFVALGQVARDHPLTQNQAVAGTMIHELGHNLCLSSGTYVGQNPTCVFSGVDTYASSDYDSAMNYNKQFSLVNYSEGLNGSNDHNDWAAILVGMDDFVTLGGDPTEPSFGAKLAFDKKPIYEKTSTDELHKAAERQAAEKSTQEEQGIQSTQSSQGSQNIPNKSSDEVTAKQNSNSRFEWTPLLLSSGTAVLALTVGVAWYMKSKRKK